MKTLRVLLIVANAFFLCSAVLIGIMWPGIPCLVAIALAYSLHKRPRQLTAHGTARWADSSDLAHLMED